jgi:hypothetical protein
LSARSVRGRPPFVTFDSQASAFRLLAIHLHGVATGGVATGGVATGDGAAVAEIAVATGAAAGDATVGDVAVGERPLIVHELMICESALVGAGGLLVYLSLRTLTLGLGAGNPRLALGRLGTLLAYAGHLTVLRGGLLTAALQLPLAPARSQSPSHREQQQQGHDQHHYDDDRYKDSSGHPSTS